MSSALHIAEAILRFDPGRVLPLEGRSLFVALRRLVGGPAAEKLLREAGAAGVGRMSAEDLATVAGVSERLARRVVAAREFGDALLEPPHVVKSSTDVARILPHGMARLEIEVMLAVALSSTLEVKALVLLAIGGSTSASLTMRDVLAPLLRLRAHAFCLVHNHPGGSSAPSPEDVDLTNRVAKAGRTIHLELLDHVIVARGGTFSFRDHDLMPTDDELEGTIVAAGVQTPTGRASRRAP